MPNKIEMDQMENLLEEFSIEELDDRLEFTAWCDGNCKCPIKPVDPVVIV